MYFVEHESGNKDMKMDIIKISFEPVALRKRSDFHFTRLFSSNRCVSLCFLFSTQTSRY